MHAIKDSFDKIMCILKKNSGKEFPMSGNLLRPGPKPKFTDLEVICLSLTAECMGYHSENELFKILKRYCKQDFPYLISRRQFNDRRKDLYNKCAAILQSIRQALNRDKPDNKEVIIVDSMPLEVCKLSRMHRSRICRESLNYAPNRGFCASQNKSYYGYKLHAVCTKEGVIRDFLISKASVHDVHYLEILPEKFSNCILIGDKGYIGKERQKWLKETANIQLETPCRANQLEQKPFRYGAVRKRIETVFSQLSGQFDMQKNYAKSYLGFVTRVAAKIAGLTVLQYINKILHNHPIGQIKYALLQT